MGHEQLREWLRRQPFRPFRIQVTGGQSYDVAGPEWMMVTPRTTAVGVPGQAGDGEVVILIDNSHIATLEPLPVAAGPTGGPGSNGTPG